MQGVFFRHSTKEKAIELDIKGEVKNLPDERVLIIATGTAEQTEQLIEWCKQGPSKAKVTNVMVEEMTLKLFEKFNIAR